MLVQAEVRAAASGVREAIVQNQDAWIGFSEFPHGSCADASILLGQYLYDANLGQWQYVAGKRHDDYTHAWLELDGLILDITADQFDGITCPVMLTKDRTWHDQFKPSQEVGLPRPALLSYFDGACSVPLRRVYGLITAQAKAL